MQQNMYTNNNKVISEQTNSQNVTNMYLNTIL